MTVTLFPFFLSIGICLYIYYTILRDRSDNQKAIDAMGHETFWHLVPLFFLSIILMIVFQLILNFINYIFR